MIDDRDLAVTGNVPPDDRGTATLPPPWSPDAIGNQGL